MKMKYTAPYYIERDTEDVGIDLPVFTPSIIDGKTMGMIYTGTRFEFPKYGRVRRFFQRMLFGFEITGLAGLVWPRSKSNMLVGAGVIDTGYRGEIASKLYNTGEGEEYIDTSVAQMILIPNIFVPMERVKQIDANTKRGEQGGIWNMDSRRRKQGKI